MASTRAGEILQFNRQAFVGWKIYDYFSISQKADHSIDSPPFHFFGGTWSFRMFPNGRRRDWSVGYIGLCVVGRYSQHRNSSFTLKIGIRCADGEIYKTESRQFNHRPITFAYGWSKYMERVELMRNKSRIIPENILEIFCDLRIISDFTDKASQTELDNGTITLSRDFHTLLQDGRKSDVTVKVQGQTFLAHKVILGARSPVFAAMFEHDMKENSSGIIDIVDCKGNTFGDFLEFIYTGDIGNLSAANVGDLFSLADKYEVGDLKKICIGYMKENLSFETACDILDLSDKHGEVELSNLAKEFVLRNIKQISSTPKWMLFVRDNPILATEILMTFVNKYSS